MIEPAVNVTVMAATLDRIRAVRPALLIFKSSSLLSKSIRYYTEKQRTKFPLGIFVRYFRFNRSDHTGLVCAVFATAVTATAGTMRSIRSAASCSSLISESAS